jgi:pilus assembly protein CpaB
MNTQRVIVLGLAVVAAGAAALLVRGLIGGGTSQSQARPNPPAIAMSDVLVAGDNLQPGQPLTAGRVRWQKWPSSAVDSSFIAKAAGTAVADLVKGTVVRSPVLAGQPITNNEIVHADAAGFMAAMLGPGMRAIAITVSTDAGAGGFILPNDRVDLMLAEKLNGTPPRVRVSIVLSDIRVLAMDQTFKQDRDTKTVLAKTATLEVTPAQTEIVTRAVAMGTLSLSLRPLEESAAADAAANAANAQNSGDDEPVTVYRYGIGHADGSAQGSAP